MTRLLSLFVLLAAVSVAVAQHLPKAYAPKYLTQFSATITERDLMAHELLLADSLLEGRETGRRGQHLAALYIASHFRRLGLAPAGEALAPAQFVPASSYFQPYFLRNSTLKPVDSAMLRIGDADFRWKTDFITLGAHGLRDSLTGPSTFLGYLSSPAPANVSGKMAWAVGSTSASSQLTPRVRIEAWLEDAGKLRDAGAAGIFIILSDADFLLFKNYGRTESESVGLDTIVTGVPVFMVTPAVAGKLFRTSGNPEYLTVEQQLRNKEAVTVHLDSARFVFRGVVEHKMYRACNVAGFLEGTDKSDEILVISAHHDHIGITKSGMNRGADDDGSGTSALLELAEAFVQAAQAGHRPRRSILFLSFSGEEKGLYGSEIYTDYPLYPLAFTVCDLNVDMIGRIGDDYATSPDSLNYIYVIGSDKLSSELHTLSEDANARFAQMKLDYTYNDEKHPSRLYYRSDHYNFAKNDIPVIFYFSGLHKDYHKPTDTPEKLLYPKMARVTRLVFATAWQIANRDGRLKVDKK